MEEAITSVLIGQVFERGWYHRLRDPQATARQENYRRTLSFCYRQGHSQSAVCRTRSSCDALRTERSMRIFDPDRFVSSQSKPNLVMTYLQCETLSDLANRHRR